MLNSIVSCPTKGCMNLCHVELQVWCLMIWLTCTLQILPCIFTWEFDILIHLFSSTVTWKVFLLGSSNEILREKRFYNLSRKINIKQHVQSFIYKQMKFYKLLLQCMKVKSEREVTQLCPTLSNPMDCSLPGSSVHGIFQARVLEWGVIAFSKVNGLREGKCV